MPDSHPHISEAELEVMKILWDRSPRTSAEIVQALEIREWSATTVKTLLSRLVKKGALEFKAEGNRYFYSPLITEEAFGIARGQEIARQFSGGPAFPVMLQFIRNADLSSAEIEELKKLLQEKNHESL